MGKASRSKGKPDGFKRLENERRRAFGQFLRRAGVLVTTSGQQMWEDIESRTGAAFADEFAMALDERAMGEHDGDGAVYDLMYHDVETAMATASFAAPMLQAFATYFQGLELPRGPLLDLGSGSGLLACFAATLRPEAQVIGVDLHPGAVECGAALAKHLELDNVSFIEADVLGLSLDQRFSVITSVASLTEMEAAGPPLRQPFSTIASARLAWEAADSALARTAAQHVDPDGVFVSFERLPGLVEFADWSGALERSGLHVSLSASSQLEWSSPGKRRESSTALVAAKLEHPPAVDFEELLNWYLPRRANPRDELGVEIELMKAENLSLLAGRHFDVRDHHGEGQTRVYVINTDSGVSLYMTTSRGWREILRRSRTGDDVMRQYNEMVVTFSAAPDVIGQRDLSAVDLENELGRPVIHAQQHQQRL
jgi:SAM-dependent methyltransferase